MAPRPCGRECNNLNLNLYHKIGPLLLAVGAAPQFAQPYVLDSEEPPATRQAATTCILGIQADLLSELKEFLQQENAFAHRFKHACQLPAADIA
jgi:hypothetical protein